MNTVIDIMFVVVALASMGVCAAFLVFLNYLKDEEEKRENEDGKIEQ